jgi:hypothetical protein
MPVPAASKARTAASRSADSFRPAGGLPAPGAPRADMIEPLEVREHPEHLEERFADSVMVR